VHRGDDFLHRVAGSTDQLRTVLDPARGIRNQRLDFLGRRRASLREAAHLARHDCEAAALIARACRFDGGVQRKDICLKGDTVDHGDDVHDAC